MFYFTLKDKHLKLKLKTTVSLKRFKQIYDLHGFKNKTFRLEIEKSFIHLNKKISYLE